MKNRILASAPSGLPDSYVHVTPGWLVAVGRVGMGSLGLVAGVAAWRGHGTLGPLMASVSAILATVLVLLALPAWARRIKFVANEQGIAFPANDLLVPVPPRANAAYGDFPPSPRRVVAILLSLKASSQGT